MERERRRGEVKYGEEIVNAIVEEGRTVSKGK